MNPVLICVEPDRAVAESVARKAAVLVDASDAVVLSAWSPPRVPYSPLVAAWEVVFEPPEEVAEATRKAAADAAQAACDALAAAGWSAERRVVRADRPVTSIALEVAGQLDASLIITGARERDARVLAHHTSRPILLVPPAGPPADPEHPAIFAYDGSRSAGHALEAGAHLLAPRLGIVSTAWEPTPAVAPAALVGGTPVLPGGNDRATLSDALRSAAQDTGEAGVTHLQHAGWPARAEVVRTSRGIWRAIVDLAELTDAAVVVTGTRGHSPVINALLGSVAEGVLRHANRPVLLVPST